MYQYPILKNLRVGIRVSSTGFHFNESNSVPFVDIIPVPGAKNMKTKEVESHLRKNRTDASSQNNHDAFLSTCVGVEVA